MADDNLPAKFHLDPFIRFAGIHVSAQFGKKNAGGHFRGKFRGEGCSQPELVLSVGKGWGYHMEETRG